jgi:adenylate cyclase
MSAAGDPEARIARWRRAGLLPDGEIPPGRVELLEGLEALGLPEETIRRAAERGRLQDAIFLPLLDSGSRERTIAPARVAQEAGIPLEELADTWRAFGLPFASPDESFFTEAELRFTCALGRLREVWPPEVYVQLARVYGQALGHLAETELRLFRLYVAEPKADALPMPEALGEVRGVFEQLLPLADPVLLSIHRRLVEQRIAQAGVQALEARAPADIPGTVTTTLLFCDLKDFSAYADQRGDEAATAAISAFADVVGRALGDGHVVKSIGDGYFMVYEEVASAVRAASAMIAGMTGGLPSVHAAVHAGRVVFREGDFFGRNVNLAARMLTLAGPRELLATAEVVNAPGLGDLGWQALGPRYFRGLREPVEVFRLTVR